MPWPPRPRSGRAAAAALCLLAPLLGTAPDPARAAAVTPAPAATSSATTSATTTTDRLEPFRASYLWYWHGAAVAFSRVVFTHRDDEVWIYDSSTEPRGLGRLYPMRPQLRSTMRIGAHGVQPLSFTASGSGRAHDADLGFDWQAARVTGTYEGVHVDMSITPGVQDDLSVQIALLEQLNAGEQPDKVFEIDRNAVRAYNYRSVGEQMLDTALGHIDTVIYEIRHPGSPRVTRFWCAPSMGYIPMQVQQKRLDAVQWTMKIRSLKRP